MVDLYFICKGTINNFIFKEMQGIRVLIFFLLTFGDSKMPLNYQDITHEC